VSAARTCRAPRRLVRRWPSARVGSCARSRSAALSDRSRAGTPDVRLDLGVNRRVASRANRARWAAAWRGRQRSAMAGFCSRHGGVVAATAPPTLGRDDYHASAGARSALASLLHPWRSGGHALAAPIDASEHPRSRPTCRRPRYRYRLTAAADPWARPAVAIHAMEQSRRQCRFARRATATAGRRNGARANRCARPPARAPCRPPTSRSPSAPRP
jgi:hypothetical protein